ncbi:MAG: hypothetical protein IVW51_17710 [Thermaceae bacterium]|nr:hypothetical protein [Thermaceae bacterium]
MTGADDFLIEDKSGQYWHVRSQQRLEATQLDQLKKSYKGVHEQNNDSRILERLKKGWDSIQRKPNGATQSANAKNVSLDYFANPDGTLNLSKAVAFLRQNGTPLLQRSGEAGVSPQYNEYIYNEGGCIWFVCNPGEVGWLNGVKTANSYGSRFSNNSPVLDRARVAGGFAQRAYIYPNRTTGFVIPGNSSLDVEMGCGPSAFVSLAWWYGKYGINGSSGIRWYGAAVPGWEEPAYVSLGVGTNQFGYPNSPNNTYAIYMASSPILRMVETKPGTRDNEPYISWLMGTSWFVNGGLTWPAGFQDGANKWLAERYAESNTNNWGVPDLVMRGEWQVAQSVAQGVFSIFNYVNPGAWINDALAMRMAGILVDEGKATNYLGEPSVAMYSLGDSTLGNINFSTSEMHYSPVLEYRVVYLFLNTQVMVKTVDHNNRWYSLANPWSWASGMFGLYPRPVAPPSSGGCNSKIC